MKPRSFLVITTLLLSSLYSHAQLKGFSLGPYAEMAIPTGNMEQRNNNGIGAGLSADIRLGKLGLTGSAGFLHFNGKTVNTNEGPAKTADINAIPMRVGLKYRFVPLLYLKVESGAANYTDGNGAAFIFSPGIGLRILGFDIQAKYEVWVRDGSNSFWGFKAGYNF